MTTDRLTRKTAFRQALLGAGLTVTEWARQNKVSRTHLYLVLDGERAPSDELDAKIEAAIQGQAA